MRRDPAPDVRERFRLPILVWQRQDGTEVEFNIELGQTNQIGRDPTKNTIAVDSSFISSTHAVVRYDGEQCVVEDLGSANGTRLNGAPVAVSVVRPGDIIEVGDQQFRLVDADADAVPARPGFSKMLKLAFAAAATLIVMLLLLLVLVPAEESTVSNTQQEATASPIDDRSMPSPRAVPDEALVSGVTSRARLSGVDEVHALYDEALLHYRAGRFRHAVHLLSAVLDREQGHQVAQARLAAAQAERARRVSAHLAEAERTFARLRFADAILEWERVIVLLERSDPRTAEAEANIARAQERLQR
ncbi:MAG: FHA domain-containing protein [SAR202 cluster bacterium]|jgi:hypothetical protein|nr:hypothetical protein [Acidobacteriota bacterium]MDP6663203.1 FHA domain-containing protein [SAR202 cluster bacterium]MDP6801381.1 FHA domain-containing protein [SAR202 cluster bacterium]MQG69085.1 FHA domain-containing protein [SAR202 cluster bacterium]HAK54705.1 hypothetical protein [Acidobacteriota bacterium]|tara:strand:+ start:2281 stop:3189 length:909 start_codon:yes stop_codon:yes gene_type:complete